MIGGTRTLERTSDRSGVIKEEDPTEVTGSKAPLPTMIDEGPKGGGGWDEVSIPSLLTICELAPELAYHSVEDGGGVRDMVLKLLINGP
jgi:hypothetical protein